MLKLEIIINNDLVTIIDYKGDFPEGCSRESHSEAIVTDETRGTK